MAKKEPKGLNALLASLKETVREAWLTLAALPDPDARFRREFGFGWIFQTINDARDAYGATPADWKRTPEKISEAEVVFEWLAWLRRENPPEGGEYSIDRIGAWALGRPTWQLAQRERCSEKTIHNRIDRSIAKILARFITETIDPRSEADLVPLAESATRIEIVDEAEPTSERIRAFAPPAGRSVDHGEVYAGKVYIAGVGMMYRGQRYSSAYDFDDTKLRKNR